MTRSKLLLAALFASLMTALIVGAAVAPATAQSGPDGMVALGDEQVHEDLPDDSDAPIRADDLEGAVYASDHADTLEVTVTTPERAEDHLENGSVISEDDDVAIVLSDDEVHDGRDVAVDTDVLEDGVGYKPDVAYGVHESGEEWQSAIEPGDGVSKFNVPEFSDNSVTFSGGIELSGDSAGDGSNYEYELADLDGTTEPEINVTGVENTESASTSGVLSDEESLSLDVGGTTDPRDGQVEFTGTETTSGSDSVSGTISDGGSDTADVGGNADPSDEEITLEPPEELDESSESTTVSGTGTTVSETVSIGGTHDPTDEEVSIEASGGSTSITPEEKTEIGADGNGAHEETVDVSDIDEIDELSFTWTGENNNEVNYADLELSIDGEVVATDTQTGDSGTFETTTASDIDMDVSDKSEVTLKIDETSGRDLAAISTEDIDGDGERSELELTNNPEPVDVSHDGGTTTVDPGSTESIDLTDGTTVEFESDPQTLDADLSWTERTGVEDVEVDVGSETVTHDGTLDEEVTESVDLSEGSNSVDASYSGKEDGLSYDLAWDETTVTEDPSVTIDGETVSHDGMIEDGETVDAGSIDLSDGSQSADISTSGEVDTSVSWTEVTETRDPVVEVNGHETTHDGTLEDGETESLAGNEGWLENGTNTVNVTTSSPETGPESLAGFEYSHDASGTTREVDVEATSWTETLNVNHTYPAETADANAVLTFDEDVVEISDVEYRTDDGEWQSPPDYELDGTDLEVEFGDVDADTDLQVRADGRKVKTYDGEVDILEPTVEGDELATEVELSELQDDTMFGLRVDGTELGDRVHYASEESWSGDSAHAEISSSGTQILRAPDANNGSTMTVESSPLSVEPESGAAEVVVEDGEEPRFKIREGNTTGSASIDITYHDAQDGERYVLWSETQDREIDSDRANSPVTFTTDDSSETYTIRQMDEEGSATGGAPPEEGGSSAPLLLVLPAVGISVTGLFYAGRRFGGTRGIRGNAILLVGSTIVSAAALEIVTPGSLIAQIYRATVFALGDAVAGGIGATFAAIATILGLWQVQRRTDANVPIYVTIPSVTIVSILALEAIRPGSVLGPLEGVIAEVGALLAIVILAWGIYWWRQRSQVRQEEASTPDTQVQLDLEDQGDD
ncbi:hypothetical protein U4E84_09640 [Halorubrum sp. AD140]|uniref:hypothetical protein n=1 Tax=Halorubrum sp. AD140 TaxID=3050073 RepID=UPI002ACC98B9|nr:hypothetical protein [Halorubrum sp. AD140]MDZ5811605.1 hypothetical protein [Halorubrum sp. AD140]